MKEIVILGSLNKSRQRRCVFDIYKLCPTLTAGMGMGGGMMPYIVEATSKYEPIGTLATHNSKNFGCCYTKDIFKCVKANNDIGVLYERK